ncbi:sugar phosphate nucleotidyltransferase [Pseudacidovorax sp. NFM-22]|uniref:sugar phosphate nucleotidyltransferase n=1 Tax=Pseudacidovorax sp. NFM-22 TaxID=2744469 RepID=UPI001F19DC47|nr:sugar phosphate nucleotidyltransferase [Pseudacidovorax sp. NFM-22]
MMEPALVLAGGLGTRLRAVVGMSTPKPMAMVGGEPFLHWLLRMLARQGVPAVYLSVGFLHDAISGALGDRFEGLDLHYVVEPEPLGTGGAVALAASRIAAPRFLVLNGDTLAAMDLQAFAAQARADAADLSIALAQTSDVGRYGAVLYEPDTRKVTGFAEKGGSGAGWINAGVYMVDKAALQRLDLPTRFSFERDLMADRLAQLDMRAWPGVQDFIDIGVPEDYALAQTKVPRLVGSSPQGGHA